MNIFFLDSDPIVAARMLADVHCGSKSKGGKMIVESTQMLCNCYDDLSVLPKTQNGTIRKYGYTHHPCSKWVKASKENFYWLLTHVQEMIKEKKYRGGNGHFCEHVIDWIRDNPPSTFSSTLFTTPALAMPEKYMSEDPINSYRDYYIGDKSSIATWSVREQPYWWN